jgi:hypothetical protein
MSKINIEMNSKNKDDYKRLDLEDNDDIRVENFNEDTNNSINVTRNRFQETSKKTKDKYLKYSKMTDDERYRAIKDVYNPIINDFPKRPYQTILLVCISLLLYIIHLELLSLNLWGYFCLSSYNKIR